MVAEDSKWIYDPNVPLAIIGSIIYGVLFIAITYLTFIKYRAWWFTVVVIGAAIEVASYVLRAYSAKNQSELVPLVLTLTLVVIAPIFVAAGNYMLISRLILSVLTPANHRVLRIPGRYLTPIFVTCDIVAALVQGNGSGVAASDEYTGESERIGRLILVGGLVFQLTFFSFFMAVFGRFHWLARNKGTSPTAPIGWIKVVIAVYVSSILIMIRCVYRVCEFAEGLDGYAFRNEWLFWVFETLPMIGAIGIFVFYHPAKYLGRHGAQDPSTRRFRGRRPRKARGMEGDSTESTHRLQDV